MYRAQFLQAVARICGSSLHADEGDPDGQRFAPAQPYLGILQFDGSVGSDHHQGLEAHRKRKWMTKMMGVESSVQNLGMSIGA